MDRILYQLTVLASTACIGVISLSILFPSQRQVNSLLLSPEMANNPVILETEN